MTNAEIDRLKALLLWARQEKIVLSTVTLGDVTVEIERDHGMKLPDPPLQAVERKQSIYEQYAGRLLVEEPATDRNEPTVEDEE